MSGYQSFHTSFDAGAYLSTAQSELIRQIDSSTLVKQRSLGYRLTAHFHPYVAELVDRLIEGSVAGLQAADTDYLANQTLPDGHPRPVLYQDLFSATQYAPSGLVAQPYPVRDLDFSSSGAYSVYNWELFYHVPLTVAIHLSRNQRFDQSQKWFHYIFDPTDNSAGPTPQRFWKFRPFQFTDVQLIEDILVNLSTGTDPQLRQDTINAIGAWKDNPFRPHMVARYRQSAYMFKAVMAYLDNLIDWGDSLFSQDTGEAINEATQLYVLAANILGPRPQEVPRKGYQQPQTYASLRADLDAMGNAMRAVEADIPFDLAPPPGGSAADGQLATLTSLGSALYFCVPRNDKLLGYWDTVADRLFKIRNSLNIQGVLRQLPLFDPPIDPALLARATAAGLDVAAVLSGLNQPLPLIRFGALVTRAVDLAQQVVSLGAGLLAAIEKQDGEAMALLRAQHETATLSLAEAVRYGQYQDAVKAREGLEVSLANAIVRYTYYERQLGKQPAEITVPALSDLDTDALADLRLKATEPGLSLRDTAPDISTDLGQSGGRVVSSYEATELSKMSDAQSAQDIAAGLESVGAFLNLIPMASVDGKPLGVGGGISIGGMSLSQLMSGLASVSRAVGARLNYEGNRSAKIGGYARRELEWAYQSNTAAGEINQIYKQLRAAQIREAVANREWTNHQKQIAQAQEIEAFLTDERTGKTTNEAFYTWQRREVRGVYGQAYQLAFDVARKAERALQHELGDPRRTFLQPSYLGGKQGLLAGEKLLLDIKQMEIAYQDSNRREYELTKHVSLAQVDPVALLRLRATGRCTVNLPEELFDLDAPGHYFRRLRSVAVSVPCVAGPYTSVNTTLTLLKSSVRTSPQLGDGYPRQGEDTQRFSDSFGGVQSIVTSSGSNDAGLFETNLRDERYLPFEGSGAISSWQLQLPADVPQFDHDTIVDVILHLRYTAREGGEPLRAAAAANLKSQLQAAAGVGSVRLMSMRHEFPGEWARFTGTSLGGATTVAPLQLTLRPEHYPYWSTVVGSLALTRLDLFAEPGPATKATVTVYDKPTDDPPGSRAHDPLATNQAMGNLRTGALSTPPAAVGSFTMYLDDNSMTDIWLALTWGAAQP